MDEVKEALKQRYVNARDTMADRNIPVRDAISQVSTTIRKDLSTATDLKECRAKRKQAIAERLQQERKKNGLKQQDVAEKTGINVVTLSGYEIAKNEPHAEALVRLADVYDVTLDYLMCRTDE